MNKCAIEGNLAREDEIRRIPAAQVLTGRSHIYPSHEVGTATSNTHSMFGTAYALGLAQLGDKDFAYFPLLHAAPTAITWL